MGRKADVKLRLEVESCDKSSSHNYGEVLKLLPEPRYYHIIGETRILTDGWVLPTPNTKTLINFTSAYSTYEIDECTDSFLKYWNTYYDSLNIIIKKYGYSLYLNFEITVYNLHYPALIFKKEFIDFISNLNIELSFYFYNDD